MPRPIRSTHAGTVYHLISRFVGQEFFIRTAEERRQYLQLFGMGISKSDWRCVSYAVMSNHIHAAVLAGEMPLVSWLREPHSIFAEYMNEKHRRIGAVFVRGPNAVPYREDGVARLIAYIHNNPVRAGLVAAPADSDWTSHRAYLGTAEKPEWLDVGLGLELSRRGETMWLDSWQQTDVSRADLEAVRLVPRRVIPPRFQAELMDVEAHDDEPFDEGEVEPLAEVA